MAYSLKNPPPPARGAPQVLPSVKCSSCGKPVPLDDLGDHVCAPQVVPAARRPMHSPNSAAALLPPRLQNLANAPRPTRSPIPTPTPTPSSRMSPKPQDRPVGHFPSALNPAAKPGAGARTMEDRARSPLARSDHDRAPMQGRPIPAQERMRAPSAPQRDFRPERREMDRPMYPQSQSTPTSSPLRSYVQSNPDRPPQNVIAAPRSDNMRPPPPPLTPPIEKALDTKIGGEAGMAGVGRRGFQAAALAAMNAAYYGQPSPPMEYRSPSSMGGRRADAPRYLDIDATRGNYPLFPSMFTEGSFHLLQLPHLLSLPTPTPLLRTPPVPFLPMPSLFTMTGIRLHLVPHLPHGIPTPNPALSLLPVCLPLSRRIFPRHRKHHFLRRSRPNYHSLRNTRTNCPEAILTLVHPKRPMSPAQSARLPLPLQVLGSPTCGAELNLKVAILHLDQRRAEETNHSLSITPVTALLARYSPKAPLLNLGSHTLKRLAARMMRRGKIGRRSHA